MRYSELAISAALMGLSAWFMHHATVLPIGWNGMTGGPGGGAFPFWLSLGVFGCSAVIFGREVLAGRAGRHVRAPRFFRPEAVPQIAMVAGALVAAIALIPIIGTYGALPLMMIFLLKVVGRHGWGLTLILSLTTPVVLFFFFEAALRILLPKGLTEPWFVPLYALVF